MAHLATTLIRSVARAFYGPEHILILDAVLLHSTLRDDELAYVMGSQTKHVRRLCFKLREDGLLHMQSQQEIRQGANRASSRDYYFVNYHLAIDNIKWRLKSMQRDIVRKHGQTEDEKKAYSCPQCKSEYTEMEVLDTADMDGNFTCRRCSHILQMRTENEEDTAGNEKVSSLNAQLGVFEHLMRSIDSTNIPENDWDHADAAKRPIVKDDSENPVAKSERVMPKVAATTHGLKMEQDQLHVSVQDSKDTEALAAAEKTEKMRKLGQDNALPEWIAASTITGEQTALGREEQERREQRERELGLLRVNDDEVKDKKAVKEVEESEHMKAYRAAMMEAAQQEAEEEEEEEDEDDDEFEDVSLEEADRPSKKPRIEDSRSMNGEGKHEDVDTESDPSPEKSKPTVNGDGAAKTMANKTEDDDSDEDDDEFEDVI